MDRAFDLPAPPDAVWPWIAQLGKNRSGWYQPGWVERFVPRRRARRRIEPALQHLRVGDVIDDWGGAHATYWEIVTQDAPNVLVHRSTRGAMQLSWAIVLHPEPAGLGHRRLAEIGGGLLDLLTIAGLAAGLRERLAEPARPRP